MTAREQTTSVAKLHLKSKEEVGPHCLMWGTRSSVSRGNQRISDPFQCFIMFPPSTDLQSYTSVYNQSSLLCVFHQA